MAVSGTVTMTSLKTLHLPPSSLGLVLLPSQLDRVQPVVLQHAHEMVPSLQVLRDRVTVFLPPLVTRLVQARQPSGSLGGEVPQFHAVQVFGEAAEEAWGAGGVRVGGGEGGCGAGRDEERAGWPRGRKPSRFARQL